MAGGKVIEVKSKQQWDDLHAGAKNDGKVIIVDFSAVWCGPCRMISPVFEKLSTEFETIIFIKVDVDEVDAVAKLCGISAMPTFQVWKNGDKIDEMVGANKDRLEAICKQYA